MHDVAEAHPALHVRDRHCSGEDHARVLLVKSGEGAMLSESQCQLTVIGQVSE